MCVILYRNKTQSRFTTFFDKEKSGAKLRRRKYYKEIGTWKGLFKQNGKIAME